MNQKRLSIINEMFLGTADQNYVTARWCFFVGHDFDFGWMSVHAIEKYLKAIILANGQRVERRRGHDIVRLLDDVRGIVGNLLPNDIQPRPQAGFSDYEWPSNHRPVALKTVMTWFYGIGNADMRYHTYSSYLHTSFLHMLDATVWEIRRLAVPLDSKLHPNVPVTFADEVRAGKLVGPGERACSGTKRLDTLLSEWSGRDPNGITDGSEGAFLAANFAFAPDLPHSVRPGRSSIRNAAIDRHVMDVLIADPNGPLYSKNQLKAAIDDATWLLENIPLSGDDQKELTKARDTAAGRLKRMPKGS